MQHIQTAGVQLRKEIDDALKQHAERLIQLLNGLQRIFRTELDAPTLEIYTTALLVEDPVLLRRAVSSGVREWKFFPSIAEILSRIPKTSSASRAEQAEQNIHNRYKQAHQEGRIPRSPYKSLLEPETSKLLAAGTVDRKTLLKLGVVEPKELSPIELEQRLEFLRDQARSLEERSGVLDQAAGAGAGLV